MSSAPVNAAVGVWVDRDLGHEADSSGFDARLDLPSPADYGDGIEPGRALLPGRDFIDFYGRSWLALLSYARRLVSDAHEAEEVVQDAFLKLFIAMPELENEGHAMAYMRRTIQNLCIDRYRKTSRRPTLSPISDEHLDIESEESAIDPVVAAEDAAVIREALARLKWEHREALISWEIEGASTAEIAARIGVDEKNVKHTLNRARAALRRLLVGSAVDPEVDLSIPEQLSVAAGRAKDAAPKIGALLLVPVLALYAATLRNSEGSTTASASRVASKSRVLVDRMPSTSSTAIDKPPTEPTMRAHLSGRRPANASNTPVRPSPPARVHSQLPQLSFAANRPIRALVAPRLTGLASSPPKTSILESGMRWNYSTLTDEGVVVVRSELQMGSAGLTWTVRPFVGGDGEFVSAGALTAPVTLQRDDQGNLAISGSFAVPHDGVSLVGAETSSGEAWKITMPRRFDIKLSVSPDLRSVLSQKVTTVF